MVVQVDTTGRDRDRDGTKPERQSSSKQEVGARVGARVGWGVSKYEEEGQVDGEVGHKLGVGGWHAVALAEHFCRHALNSLAPAMYGDDQGS